MVSISFDVPRQVVKRMKGALEDQVLCQEINYVK